MPPSITLNTALGKASLGYALIALTLAMTLPSEAAVFRYRQAGDWPLITDGVTPGWGLNPNNSGAPGALPGDVDDARINWSNNTVTVTSAVPTVNRVQIGVDASGILEVGEGGVLTANQDILAGNNNVNATGTLRVNSGGTVSVGRILWSANNESTGFIEIKSGGSVTVASHLWWGVTGDAVIDISGTLTQTGGILGLGTKQPSAGADGGTATVNILDGGLLALNNIHGAGLSIFAGSSIDITGSGQLTLPNNFVGVLTTYATNGFIGGYGVPGMSNLVIDLTTNPGFTTVTAIDPREKPFEISGFAIDDDTGDITLVWDSEEGAFYRVAYDSVLSDWDGEIDDSYPADAGDSTMFTFNKSSLSVAAANADQVFFRIEVVPDE